MPLDTRPRISFDPPGVFPLRLARLREQEHSELRRIAVPMKTDCGYKFRARASLLLPKLYVAVEARFGRCAPLPGAHKTSFSVPLLLSALRDDGPLHYLVTVSDLRGSPNVDYYRLDRSRLEGFGPMSYESPVEREISGRQFDALTNYLLDHLLATATDAAQGARPFFRTVPSEGIIYGKRNGDLFEVILGPGEEYACRLAAIRAELGDVERRAELADLDAIVANVEGDTGC